MPRKRKKQPVRRLSSKYMYCLLKLLLCRIAMFICVKVGKQVFSKYTCFNRDFEKLTKDVEETKEKFADFEKQDVKCREDLKHAKGKTKKLDKTLEQEKKRVSV